MQVKIPTLPKDEAVALVEEAHEKVCPYSHATRGNIDFSLEVEGAWKA
jgi:osmotically inducible protein OsmC